MTDTTKSNKYKSRASTKVFSDAERAAIVQRAEEQKAEARRGSRGKKGAADGESDVLAKIAEMPESDRVLATRLHAIIKDSAPTLSPKSWYGMPSYARDGKIVCFYQGAYKFNTRYAMLGFNDSANLDDGHLWPVYFALTELTAADEATIAELLQKALS
jgi:uncharacterized protein YdhG (YjbR/CyaY superfamily)